jgi:hypothetical protein
MMRAVIVESRVFASWSDYQEALIRAIAPLTPEQLQQRHLPTLRTPGEIAAHIVYGRALHLTLALGVPLLPCSHGSRGMGAMPSHRLLLLSSMDSKRHGSY